MTNDEYDERVAHLAALAAENPGGYKKRLLLMALLGNAYLGAMLLLLVTLLVLSIYSIAYLQVFGIELAVILGASLWLLLRALRVKIATPEGLEVSRRDSPELFAVIDEFH